MPVDFSPLMNEITASHGPTVYEGTKDGAGFKCWYSRNSPIRNYRFAIYNYASYASRGTKTPANRGYRHYNMSLMLPIS